MQQKLASYEARLSAHRLAANCNEKSSVETAAAATSAAATALAPTTGASTSVAEELLSLHAHWDWQAIAHEMLQPFAYIDNTMVTNALKACNENGTMYCSRVQVKNNELFITDYRAVFFDRHYAPARVMPMLDVLRGHQLPDVDLVVAAVDEPRIKAMADAREWTRMVSRYPGMLKCEGIDPKYAGEMASLPPPLFSSTVDRAHFDLAWPDFSFYMPRRAHKLRTPPWSKLHPQMLRESATVVWKDKIELAVHTGNVGSAYRKRLADEAKRSPNEILVNELFIGDHGKIRSTCAQLGLHKQGGFQQHKCYMTFTEQCGYKYLLNSASIGYANKFKYLLLCGSVVIYVRDGMSHKEFYEYGLLPGVHYVTVESASEVPAMVRWLKKNDDYARAVALAGRARMATLDTNAVAAFMAELLKQYARKQTYRVEVGKGAVRIECEDDLWRHYARDPYWLQAYKMEDNATCIRPPKATTFGPPGFGGSYAGSKARCAAAHDQRKFAQPEACLPRKETGVPHQPGTSFDDFETFPKPGPKEPYDWERAEWKARGSF